MSNRRFGPDREIVVRVVSAIASVSIGAAAILVLTFDRGNGATDASGEVPSVAYLILVLLCAGAIGLIGAVRGSRVLIGAAGGLTLPIGLAPSLLAIPAVVLIAACGVVPAKRPPSGRELLGGVAVVLLGLSTFIVPALLASPGCWIAIDAPTGVMYEVVRVVPKELPPGRSAVGCAEKMPPAYGFPIALGLAVVALALSARLSTGTIRKPARP